jgi:hypothetical protein
MFKNNFLNFQDRLFVIKKILKEEDRPIVEVWKEHLRADTVLKKERLLYFLEEVCELEIIT